MEGNDADAIKKGTEELTQASHKLAEAVYAKALPDGAEQPGEAPHEEGGKDENVVDADFEEVKEDKK